MSEDVVLMDILKAKVEDSDQEGIDAFLEYLDSLEDEEIGGEG